MILQAPFTQRVHGVLSLAGKEADRLGQNWIGTGHILLVLTREEGLAHMILDRLLSDMGHMVRQLQNMLPDGRELPSAEMEVLSQSSVMALQLAAQAARERNQNYVGTEHLLIGLLKEGEGLAGNVLLHAGVTEESIGRELAFLLGKGS